MGYIEDQKDSESTAAVSGAKGAIGTFELPVLSTDEGTHEDVTAPARTAERERIDMAALQERLAGLDGEGFWRSLDELAETSEFKDYLEHEFPEGADSELDPVSRRHFLKVMSASFALAGLGACVSQPDEKIVPYVRAPEQIVPGKAIYFATALLRGGYATGILAESHMGRPTKIEGNPDHPASLGATSIFDQAAVLNLYDPDRSKTVLYRGEQSTWSNFMTGLTAELDAQKSKGGAGIRILTETVTSPTLADQMRRIKATYPAMKWVQYEAIGQDNTRAGIRAAAGRYAEPVYRFDQADIIVSLDSDFLFALPGSVAYGRQFIDGRRVGSGKTTMNRLYVAESTPSITGAMADHRLPARSSDIEGIARAIAAEFGVATGQTSSQQAVTAWVGALVRDLKAHNGRSVLIAGETQPAYVHMLVYKINQALGSVGTAVTYTAPVEANPTDHIASMKELMADIDAGGVDVLLMLGANPAFNAPADLNFLDHLKKVNFRVHLGLYDDETSKWSHWHIPEAHSLEAWSDARSYDGTTTIMQPLIAPLYSGKTAHEVLAVVTGEAGKSGYELVRGYWMTQGIGADFERAWQLALNDGMLANSGNIKGSTAAATLATTQQDSTRVAGVPVTGAKPDSAMGATMRNDLNVNQRPAAQQPASQTSPAALAPSNAPAGNAGDLEIVFRPDPSLWDGRYSNNGWLQELPKPLTKLTWDSAAYISPATAARLGLSGEDLVEITYKGRKVNAPILVVAGHANDSVTVFVGNGRERVGRVGNGTGFNGFALRTSDTPWFGSGVQLTKVGHYKMATTQHHFAIEGRDLVRSGSLAEYKKNPSLLEEAEGEAHVTLFPEYKYEGYAWGMSIDINACIGCNACIIACQAENNIPVVGKEQTFRGREMHWLRVDTYFKGSLDNPSVYFQPLPCQHCEQAPCEVVCPVNATVHDHEGLNVMVYNRCVGTRYCSNNCPYKVRRFNFLLWNDDISETEKMGKNPDVTIRSRGVMEKCSYCIQRISYARIESKKRDSRIMDGEIQTACQTACPTNAIIFGDINDKTSKVAHLKAEPRNYGILTELNTQPRTSYMGRVHNPNPELEKA